MTLLHPEVHRCSPDFRAGVFDKPSNEMGWSCYSTIIGITYRQFGSYTSHVVHPNHDIVNLDPSPGNLIPTHDKCLPEHVVDKISIRTGGQLPASFHAHYSERNLIAIWWFTRQCLLYCKHKCSKATETGPCLQVESRYMRSG